MPNNSLIKRGLFKKILLHLNKPEMTIITGARQVGKTVLLDEIKGWLTKGKNENDVIFFNLDLTKDWEFFQDQTAFIQFIKEKSLHRKIYVLVDEAQKTPDCARFFKGVYDSGLQAKFILTGSASFELKSKLQESLAGRKKVFNLLPFSFNEYLAAKMIKIDDFTNISNLSRRKLIGFYKDYLIWGGYPKVVLAQTNEERIDILEEIYSSYIEKDIIGLFEIKNRLGFSRLVKLLAGQTGQLVNIAELSNNLNLDRQTIERHLNALEKTFIIKPLIPFFRNPRQEVIKQNKIYFTDTGLRNFALENFEKIDSRIDGGLILENEVAKELNNNLKTFEKIRFWRTKQGAEVDFIVIFQDKIIPLEVKLNLRKPTLSRSLQSFIQKFNPAFGFMVNLALSNKKILINKTTIYVIHPFEITYYLNKLLV
jgi:predicted AAA+ superfamily ATPase